MFLISWIFLSCKLRLTVRIVTYSWFPLHWKKTGKLWKYSLFQKSTRVKWKWSQKNNVIHFYFWLVAGFFELYINISWFPPHWKTLDKLTFSKKKQKSNSFFLPKNCRNIQLYIISFYTNFVCDTNFKYKQTFSKLNLLFYNSAF